MLYWMDTLGAIFVGLLKMILIPLIFTSIAAGIINLKNHAQMGRVWKYTLIYFLASPVIAAVLGLLLVNVFEPGKGLDTALFEAQTAGVTAQNLGGGGYFRTFLSGI